MYYNSLDNIKLTQALNPIQATSTRTSASTYVVNYQANMLIVYLGFSLDTLSGSRYWTIKIQHSDNGSSFSDVASTDVVGGVTSYVVDDTTEDETAYKFSYIGNKAYIRGVATATGSMTNGTPMSMVVLLVNPLFPTGD